MSRVADELEKATNQLDEAIWKLMELGIDAEKIQEWVDYAIEDGLDTYK